MNIFDQIAERRIAEAAANGDFDGLPGAGRPLELDDDSLVPPELRVAYRLLKNAGYVPDEAILLAELASAERLLMQTIDTEERTAAALRLRLLLDRLGSGRAASLQSQADYFERLLERADALRRAAPPDRPARRADEVALDPDHHGRLQERAGV